MVTFTTEEEAKYAYLQKEGYGDLADCVRGSWTRAHETFDKLSKADVDSVYGPAITEDMRSAMKKAIADSDHSLVYSIHNLFLTLEGKDEADDSTSPKTSTTNSVSVGLGTFALIGVMLAATIFAVMVLIGS